MMSESCMEHVVLQELLPPLRTVPSHGMSRSFQHASSWMGKRKRETAISDHSWKMYCRMAKTTLGSPAQLFCWHQEWKGAQVHSSALSTSTSADSAPHPEHWGAELRDGATSPPLHSDIQQHRLATPADPRPPRRSLESLPLDSHHALISWPMTCCISPDTGGNPTPKDASEVRHLPLLAGSSSKLTTSSLTCHMLATSTLTVAERNFTETHWYYSLQADVEVLFLIGFEFFQGNSSFSNKLIVAKFVFITHRDPEGNRKGEHQPGWSST